MFDAFHLPALVAAPDRQWIELPAGARAPALQPADIGGIAVALRTAGLELRSRGVADIIEAIEAAARLLVQDPETRERTIDVVARLSGYSAAMTAHVIDRMIADWTAPALHELVISEFRDPGVLDGFRPLPSRVTAGTRLVHAHGAGLALHIFSGNVPGVAVTSMIRSLLVKCPVLGKTASGEPALPVLFARALSAVDPALGNALAVTYWPGGDDDIERAAIDEADQVVHYGGAEALAGMRAKMPARLRLIEHGPRISFGVVGREALQSEAQATDTARDVAYAASVFDQQGCVSPHTIFVESGAAVDAELLATLIDHALTHLARNLPSAALNAGEAAAIRRVRTEAEFREIAGEKVSVKGPEGLEHTVIYDSVPALTASCLGRTLRVCPIDDLGDIAVLIEPFHDILQSVGVAGAGDRLVRLAQQLSSRGVTRVTDFRTLPWPSMTWRHDGRGPLLELVYWSEIAP